MTPDEIIRVADHLFWMVIFSVLIAYCFKD